MINKLPHYNHLRFPSYRRRNLRLENPIGHLHTLDSIDPVCPSPVNGCVKKIFSGRIMHVRDFYSGGFLFLVHSHRRKQYSKMLTGREHLKNLSIVQVDEQPSRAMALPSSQSSRYPSRPSPQNPGTGVVMGDLVPLRAITSLPQNGMAFSVSLKRISHV